jgi:hypothetical protein
MPAAPISTIPQGLLGLLQLKEMGVNPAQLVQTVSPNLEMFNFYIQRLAIGEIGLFGAGIQSNGTINGHGQANLVIVGTGGTPAQVPSNEMWYVVEFNVGGQLVAADYIRIAPCIIPTPAAGALWEVGPDYNDVVSARAREFMASSSQPFFAPPGSQFAFRVFDATSVGGITVNGGLRAARIPI